MENLSGGDCCDCDCCDGGKTKSTPSLGFRLRLEFDNIALALRGHSLKGTLLQQGLIRHTSFSMGTNSLFMYLLFFYLNFKKIFKFKFF